MSRSKKFVIIVIILLVIGYCLMSLRHEKPKDDAKESDKGSYTCYIESSSDSEDDGLYFYGK